MLFLTVCHTLVLLKQTNECLNIFSRTGLTLDVDSLLVANDSYDEMQDLLSSILFHAFCCFILLWYFSSPVGISTIHFVALFLSLAICLSLSLSICLRFFFYLTHWFFFSRRRKEKRLRWAMLALLKFIKKLGKRNQYFVVVVPDKNKYLFKTTICFFRECFVPHLKRKLFKAWRKQQKKKKDKFCS